MRRLNEVNPLGPIFLFAGVFGLALGFWFFGIVFVVLGALALVLELRK